MRSAEQLQLDGSKMDTQKNSICTCPPTRGFVELADLSCTVVRKSIATRVEAVIPTLDSNRLCRTDNDLHDTLTFCTVSIYVYNSTDQP